MHHRNCSYFIQSCACIFLWYYQMLFCFKYKFVRLWFTIFTKKACFMCIFHWNMNISHFLCHFNRFCWVQMLACLEECLEWCLLLLGSCDDVYIVTSMSSRRRRGKREGAGTGEWCEKMLWLVNIKKSLPCIVCVYSGDLNDFLWTSLSLCLSHKTFCIDCRPSSDLLLFYYIYRITFLSEREYSRFWGIFRLL